jgi:hypothetical protein
MVSSGKNQEKLAETWFAASRFPPTLAVDHYLVGRKSVLSGDTIVSAG